MNVRTLSLVMRDLPLLCGGALLYIAAFSPLVWGLSAWVAVCPLYLVVLGQSPRAALLSGTVYGLLVSAGLTGWFSAVSPTLGAVDFALEVSLTFMSLGLSFGLACGLAAAVSCTLFQSESSLLRWIGIPAVWVGGELLRTCLSFQAGADLLGYTQYQTLALIQIADVTGVYGLSFLLALSGCVSAECVHTLPVFQSFRQSSVSSRSNHWLTRPARFSWTALGGLGLGVALSVVYGVVCLQYYPPVSLAAAPPAAPVLPEAENPLIAIAVQDDNRPVAAFLYPPEFFSAQPVEATWIQSRQEVCADPAFLPVAFRAIESRQPFWPSGAEGQFGFVDPAGRCYVLSKTQAQMVLRQAMPKPERTVYTEYGDWFAFACIGFAAMAVLRSTRPGRDSQRNRRTKAALLGYVAMTGRRHADAAAG